MIPFSKVMFGKEEENAVIEVLRSGWVASGPKVAEFERFFAGFVGAKHGIFTNGGTSALKVALLAMDGYPGGVVVPSLTFTATASAVRETGNTPIFADVILPELTLDPNDVQRRVLNGVKAVIPVNYGGNKAWSHYPGHVIVDSAHRIEPDDFDPWVHAQCYSFYATKNISTTMGGMVVTNSDEYASRMRLLVQDGVSKSTRERYNGDPHYTVEKAAGGYDGNDLLAAIGLEQLKKYSVLEQRREEILEAYNNAFDTKWEGTHLYPIFMGNRDAFVNFMKEQGIATSVHYHPLHLQPAYANWKPSEPLAVSEWVGERVVSLPMHPGMSDEDVKTVISKVKEWNRIHENTNNG